MNAPFEVLHADVTGLQPSVDFSVVIAIAPLVYEVLESEAMLHHFLGPIHKRYSLRSSWHPVLA